MPSAVHKNKEHITYLLAVDVNDTSALSAEFLDWDTEYCEVNEAGDGLAHFALPKGKVLILFLFTISPNFSNTLWTTIRRFTPNKEQYYRKHIGKQVGIEC
jgi:hypothetical protein